MRGLKGVLLGFCVTGIISILFYYITMSSTSSYQYRNKEVFSAASMSQLTSENLVDLLVKNVDTSHIKAIEFKSHVLKVDLILKEAEPLEFVYKQLPQFIYFSFLETNNVEQLLLRVFDQQGLLEQNVVILTSQIYRNDAWLSNEDIYLDQEKWLEDRKWQQRLRLNKTIYWQNHYEI